MRAVSSTSSFGRNAPGLLAVLFVVLFVAMCEQAHAGVDYWHTSQYPDYVDTTCIPPHFTGSGDWMQCVADAYESGNAYWTTGNTCDYIPPVIEVTTPVFEDTPGSWRFEMRVLRATGSTTEQCDDGGTTIISSSEKWIDFDLSVDCTGTEEFNPETGLCEEPAPTCDGSVTGTAFLRPVFSGGSTGDICHESSQCKLTATSVTGVGSDDLIEYTGTGDDCTSEPEIPLNESNEGPNCISSGGDTWCTEPDLADENCGYLNDEYLCLDSIPEGECTFYGNGDMACSSTAGSPPAPDDGVTPGTPATPDTTIDNNGTDIDIFDNGTVGGSTGGTSGTSQPQGPGSDPQELNLDFSEIIETEPDSGSFDDDVLQDVSDMADDTQGLIDDLTDPADFGESTTVGVDLTSALGYTACADVVISAGMKSITFSCADSQIIRDWLGWAMRVVFLIAMFQLVTTRPQ